MRMSIATVCLSGGLAEKLEAIAAAGFKGVEIFENDLLSLGSKSSPSSHSATLRACRPSAAPAPSPVPSANLI
jgi:sugar phosphate isomerase/epimerase